MSQSIRSDKEMGLGEAVDRYVDDGDAVFIQWQPFAPMAAIHEVIRQGVSELEITCASMTHGGDLMVGSGAVEKVKTGYFGLELLGLSNCFRRAVEEDVPREIEVEEYANFNIQMMSLAGALGFPFVPTKNLLGTDYLEKGTDTREFEVMESPFDGERVTLLPSYEPDVGLIHAQRADKNGNVQTWGAGIEFGLHACDTVIATVEEVVDTEIITRDPDRTVLPNHRVEAVVHEPWGAHPENVYGYYDIDWMFKQGVADAFRDPDGVEQYLEEWVHGVEDRTEYLEQYVERFGFKGLRTLVPHTSRSAPNYGSYEQEVLR
ncbi:CoA transferase subunit A [Halobacteriales archaeon Cl-PHB]